MLMTNRTELLFALLPIFPDAEYHDCLLSLVCINHCILALCIPEQTHNDELFSTSDVFFQVCTELDLFDIDEINASTFIARLIKQHRLIVEENIHSDAKRKA
jgi:hypothetical protein